MAALAMSNKKFKEMKTTLKGVYSLLRDIKPQTTGKVTDKSPVYESLNKAMVSLIFSRSLYVSAVRKFTKRKTVKEALSTIEKAANTLQSILDAIESREVTAAMIEMLPNEVAPQIKKGFSLMASTLAVQEEEPEENKFEAPKDGETPEEKKARKLRNEEAREKQKKLAQRLSMEDARRQAAKQFHKNSRHKQKLLKFNAKTTDQTMMIVRVPIIPIFKKMISPKEIKELGLDSQEVGLYTILENQIVMGINYRYTAENNIKNKEYAVQLADMLSKKMGTKLIVMEDLPVKYANTGFLYYWLVDSRDYNRLTRAGVREAGIQQWGFAF